jgi:hypothetical protein
MAARDRNLSAWMAYVIVASFVSVGLIGALGYTMYSSSNLQTTAKEAVNRAAESEKKYRDIVQNLDFVKGMLGQRQFSEAEWETMKGSISGSADFDALQSQFGKDMTLFGPSEPFQNKNYPKLAEYLMLELRARNAQVDSAAKTAQELNLKTESTVRSETDARKAAEAKANDLDKQLAEARADFKNKIDELVKTNTQTNEILQKKMAEHAREKAKLESVVKTRTNEVAMLTSRNLSLVRRIEVLENVDFQAVQGKVVDVEQGGSIVYVNIGLDDDLRPGVRFSVLNPDVARLNEAKPKAHIEIVEMVGRTQARARVLASDLKIPVLKGDVIYSPVWEKGRKVQFALMGKLDMNGDGSDDRAVIRNLIEQSGGVISEDLSPDGKSKGKMTADTRWLVIGEKFDVSGAEDLDPKIREFRTKYSDMESRARGLAVSQITLDKLLSWIRSSGDDRSMPLGNAARATDFVDKKPLRSSTGAVSEVYSKGVENGTFGRPITSGEFVK